MLKKKGNPARDFALTVLENDKKNVKHQSKDSDLNEISQLLSSTNQLLSRNSHLRASLTISVKRSNSKKATTTTFIIPNPNKTDPHNNQRKVEEQQFEYVDIALDAEEISDADSSTDLRKDSTSGASDSGHCQSRDEYFPRKSKLFRNRLKNFETFPNKKNSEDRLL